MAKKGTWRWIAIETDAGGSAERVHVVTLVGSRECVRWQTFCDRMLTVPAPVRKVVEANPEEYSFFPRWLTEREDLFNAAERVEPLMAGVPRVHHQGIDEFFLSVGYSAKAKNFVSHWISSSSQQRCLRRYQQDGLRYRYLRDVGARRVICGDTASYRPGRGPFVLIELPNLGAPSSMILEGEPLDGLLDNLMAGGVV